MGQPKLGKDRVLLTLYTVVEVIRSSFLFDLDVDDHADDGCAETDKGEKENTDYRQFLGWGSMKLQDSGDWES